MKRVISLLLALVMVVSVMPVTSFASEIVDSGTCGENVTWELTADGTLTIDGKGAMEEGLDSYRTYAQKIKKIIVSGNDIDICDHAFENMPCLTDVEFWWYTDIGEYAFADCSALVNLSLSYVNRIDQYAFANCTSLTDITIAESVTSIHALSFAGCTALSTIDVNMYNSCYKDRDGLLYRDYTVYLAEWTLIMCPPAASGEITLFPNTKTVAANSFYECNSITAVTFPKSVEQIANGFYNCSNLKTLIFEGNAPRISDNAFCGITATAYYPSDDSTWTTDVMQDYGGNITWISDGYDDSDQSATLEVYTTFPYGALGVGQTAKLLVSATVNGESVPFVSGNVENSDNTVLDLTETSISDGIAVITLKTLDAGEATITVTESSTGASATIVISVKENYEYYRCSNIPIPDIYLYPLYIADFACTENGDGTHDVSFKAYNVSYAYGVAVAYDENGTFLDCAPLNPKNDGTGMEYVANSFWYAWDSTKNWFDDRQHYEVAGNACCTEVIFENLPQNAKIVITADGSESPFPALYTGINIFLKGIFAGTGVDLNTTAMQTVVKEFLKELIKSLPKAMLQNSLQSLATDVSTALLNGITAESCETLHDLFTDMCKNMQIDLDALLKNLLKSVGWSVADTVVFTAIPILTIVDLSTKIVGLAWLPVDYKFNMDRGTMDIFCIPHDSSNQLVNSSVAVVQTEKFGENVVLDAYLVTDESEIPTNRPWKNTVKNYNVYNITLRENGAEIQPNEEITVKVPIPENADAAKCVLYRVEDNGTLTLLPSELHGNFLVFQTTHLSYYIVGELVETEIIKLGDVNGDGKLNAKDATAILKYIVGKLENPMENFDLIADVNEDGKVNAKDATKILKTIVGKDTFEGW